MPILIWFLSDITSQLEFKRTIIWFGKGDLNSIEWNECVYMEIELKFVFDFGFLCTLLFQTRQKEKERKRNITITTVLFHPIWNRASIDLSKTWETIEIWIEDKEEEEEEKKL